MMCVCECVMSKQSDLYLFLVPRPVSCQIKWKWSTNTSFKLAKWDPCFIFNSIKLFFPPLQVTWKISFLKQLREINARNKKKSSWREFKSHLNHLLPPSSFVLSIITVVSIRKKQKRGLAEEEEEVGEAEKWSWDNINIRHERIAYTQHKEKAAEAKKEQLKKTNKKRRNCSSLNVTFSSRYHLAYTKHC